MVRGLRQEYICLGKIKCPQSILNRTVFNKCANLPIGYLAVKDTMAILADIDGHPECGSQGQSIYSTMTHSVPYSPMRMEFKLGCPRQLHIKVSMCHAT